MIPMRQLEALCAVIESGSITGAADRLCISQPAVSKIIAALEDTTQLTLFKRQHRRIVPTPEALYLYDQAQRLLEGVTDIARLAEELRTLNSGSLVIGCLISVGQQALPSLIKSFLASRTSVDLTYYIRSSNKIMQWAIAQQIDIGIAMTSMRHEAVAMEELCTVNAVCALSPGHRLASKASIRAEDLEGEPFISFAREGVMRQIIDQVFESASVTRRHAATISNSHAACGLVMQSLGVSIVDPFAAQCFVPNGLIVRPFRPTIPYEFQLLLPRFREPSKIVQTFVPHLKRGIRRLVSSSGLEG